MDAPDISPERAFNMDKSFDDAMSAQGITPSTPESDRDGLQPNSDSTAPESSVVKFTDYNEKQAQDDVDGSSDGKPPEVSTTEKLGPQGREAKTRTRKVKAEEPKQPEPQPEVTPTPDPQKPTEPEIEVTDPELLAIKEPKDLGPKKSEDWKKIRSYGAKQRKQYEEAVNFIVDLQKKQGQLPPEIDAELKELRQMRALVDLRQDPDFQSKYDKKIESNATEIWDIMKFHGMSEAKVEEWKSKDKVRGYSAADPDWAGVFKSMEEGPQANDQSRKDAMILKEMLKENMFLERNREKDLKSNVGKLEQWQAARQQQEQTRVAAEDKRAEEIVGELQSKLNLPYIKELPVPTNATAEQRNAIQAHNKKFEAFKGQFIQNYQATNPRLPVEQRVDLASAPILGMIILEKNDELNQIVQRQSAELESLKKAGSVAAIGRATPPADTRPRQGWSVHESANDAIDKGLLEAMNASR